MCGICGVFYFDRERPAQASTVVAMRDTMVHRGPDGQGVYIDRNVGLGHRRLSIVDLAAGKQPMSNEDGSVWVTYNGEIYNHAELREGLLAKGHTFRTKCDTEVLVHLYEEEGDRCVESLKGMFAFAIYDAKRCRILLARDRIGIKPLYYAETPNAVVFGSEIKALLAHPDVQPALNWNVLHGFLQYGSVYGRETLFESVLEVEPGYVVSISTRGTTATRYWDLPADPPGFAGAHEQAERIEELLRVAIKRRMMSDVPLGAFLSGGVDSSLIVAMMAELGSGPVKTFSIGFSEAGFNEFSYSRAVAEKYSTDHHEFVLDHSVFFDALPDLVWHHDEPVSLPASIPLYFLSKETKGNATVILTGEGADEVFLGYKRYPWLAKQARIAAAFRAVCPSPLRSSAVSLAKRLFGADRKLFDRLALSPGQLAATFLEWSSATTAGLVLTPAARERASNAASPDFCLHAYAGSTMSRDAMSANTYLDFKTFLVTLLMKQDKMSMAASIESRVPFLDHELVEAGCALPTDSKLGRGEMKKVVKKIAEKYLPHELIYRTKQGFPVPVTPWLNQAKTRSRFEEVLLDESVRRRGMFDLEVVRERIRAAGSPDEQTARSASYLVWTLANFELWYNTFIEGTGAPLASNAHSLSVNGGGEADSLPADVH